MRALPIPFTVVLLAMPAPGMAADVALQNATATFSQSGFSIGMAIDGDVSPTGGGWAISEGPIASFPNPTHAQVAAFETASNLGASSGTDLTFTLRQLFFAPNHMVGKFRLSVTNDDRSTFADGLATSGDVSAGWVVLNPSSALSSQGATVSLLGDGSILISGLLPDIDTYTVTAQTSLTNITGFRLEVFEDASLPTTGPGRHPVNGNFVLTEFSVAAMTSPAPEPETWMMMGIGLGLMAFAVKRRARKQSVLLRL
jgi:hypothetical protein